MYELAKNKMTHFNIQDINLLLSEEYANFEAEEVKLKYFKNFIK